MKLQNKNALITGASKGLGAEIAKHYVQQGASIFICARNEQELKAKAAELEKCKISAEQKIGFIVTDIAIESQLDELCAAALKFFDGKMDILVNNAGSYGPFGSIENIDWQEWVTAINTNLLSVVYLCKKIIPEMQKNGAGKIINLSGGGATNPLARITAYAAAKAAVVRFSESIALDLKEQNIQVNAIAPGALATDLNKKFMAADPELLGAEFQQNLTKKLTEAATPLHVGAELAVYLASSASDGITGKLISAPWDKWTEFEKYQDKLAASDIYTLRRIIPEDRGEEW